MTQSSLQETARTLVGNDRGILAADESTGTCTKRLNGVGVQSTEDTRRDYRGMLFSAAGAGDFISGVILYDETLRQKTAAGKPFTELLLEQNIIPGIKVDTGAKNLAGTAGEKVTEGLDGLRERLAEYHALGARFAKWRAVIRIADGEPSHYCLDANAHALARYAALCQEAGIVPIVEPEVLMDGNHTLERCEQVTRWTHERVFNALYHHRVALEGILLKPNMIISGKDCEGRASVNEVADATVRCLLNSVPAAVPGIVFLSGGQAEVEASAHLNAMNARHPGLPWAMSFSYGRALQQSALKTWAGEADKIPAAQAAFLHRARCNSAARNGKYSEAMEGEAR
ncbi:MAG: class I fructose-bisphosphate aldolase [Polyangiaceae bacterium]